jgi:hypothetical protein
VVSREPAQLQVAMPSTGLLHMLAILLNRV